MRLFFGALIFFLIFGWLVLLFSATGLFYTGTVVLSIFASAIIALKISLKKISYIVPVKGKIVYLVILVSLTSSFFSCYYATPTIFGGRDQGAIATAAIELSKNHNLTISEPIAGDLFQKYGAGRALNFPGFDYQSDGTLASRFPVGYTAYLAAFYGLFGLKGIQFANAIPLFLFLVVFWLLLRKFFDEKVSFLGFLIAASFFPFIWFAKYALTEIYMLFLVWTGIYFLLAIRDSDSSPLEIRSRMIYFSLAFFALSSLVRIEGVVFFFLAIGYILLLNRKKIAPLPKYFAKSLAAYSLALFAVYIFLNFPALWDSAKNLAKVFLPNTTKDSIPSAGLYSYLTQKFFSYNVLPYLVLGLLGILWLAKNIRKNWLKLEFLPIFLLFPSFFYLITPQITLDDPWLFRRFVFSVFPVFIFYTVYILEKFFYHKIFLYVLLLCLAAANIAVDARFFTLSENEELLPQIEKYSQKFGPNDLVLIDRLATGSGFSLMSEPMRTLYGKNTVYFFNADDMSHIDQARYENIYMIANLEEEKPWYAELVKNKAIQGFDIVKNNFLEPNEKKFGLAQNIQAETLIGIWKIK